LYIMDINAISHPVKKRQKRLIDLLTGVLMLLLSPLSIWFFSFKGSYFHNAIRLLTGQLTVVGYGSRSTGKNTELPTIRRGILTSNDRLDVSDTNLSVKLDLLYAREYDILLDIRIILRSWKKLGRKI